MNYKQKLTCFFFVILAVACSEPQQNNKIIVQFWADNQPLGCAGSTELANSKFRIEQLGLYLSNLTLVNDDETIPLQLSKNAWQTESTALMYMPSDCRQSYNQTLSLDGSFDKEFAQTLAFNVGVPFELNHQNPLSQASPLNLPGMFWAWQNGHKFLRLDLKSTDEAFAFHLGSVGCASSSRVRAPDLPCAKPNFFSFKLLKQQKGAVLKVNLDKLLDGIELRPENSCLFHSEQESSCQLLIDNLQTNQVFEWL